MATEPHLHSSDLVTAKKDIIERGHELHITASDATGNRVFATVQIEVEETEFERGGFIRLSNSQTRARENQEAINQANADRMAAYATRSDEAMWAGSMRPPVEGRITSIFGRYREYSDGARSHHYGTDYGAPEGTHVFAPSAGTVTLSEEQIIYGNVVILDHGQGISSSYNHMRVNTVREGDTVIAGQQVGEVGSTGQSTGPHLHWGMNIDGVAVDARQWLETDFLPDTETEWFVLDTESIEEWLPVTTDDAVEPGAEIPNDDEVDMEASDPPSEDEQSE